MLLELKILVHVDADGWAAVQGVERDDVPSDFTDAVEDLIGEGLDRSSVVDIECRMVSDE